MADNKESVWLDVDELYTEIVNTMLHLYALCWHEIEPWDHRDVLEAVVELRSGGWRHAGGNIYGKGMSFLEECLYVEGMLNLLDGVATDTVEKGAIARARYWLEPNPQHIAPPSARG